MKLYFLAAFSFCLLFQSAASAADQIDVDCEKKLIKAAIKEKESHHFLEYRVEGIVKRDLFVDYIEVVGTYDAADPFDDYSYAEIYKIGVKKETCEIVSVEIVDIINN